MEYNFNITPKEAVELQKKLREQVKLVPLSKKIRYIAGCDVSLNLYSTTVYAGFVVLSYPDLTLVDHAVVKDEVTFPYVPGLLSFREIPALLKAWQKLKVIPDVIMVDGQGVAHPRRLGIATHLGLVLDIPTIGCAKSVLTGKFEMTKNVWDANPLIDPKNNEMIGFAFQSKARSNPLIISAGYKVTQEEALEIVKICLRGYRLPEPTRLAHNTTNEYRKKG